MANGEFRVFDSDLHLIEPPDLWQRYIEPEFRSQVPVGTTRYPGDIGLQHEGKQWGHQDDGVSPRKKRFFESAHFAESQARWTEFEAKGWTGEAQLQAMDIEGIDVAVLYPSRGLYALADPELDPRLAAAIARAYNNWLHDFMEPDRERLLGAAMLSPFDIEDAIAETLRVKELGFKAVFLRSSRIDDRNWHDPSWDRLWGTIQDSGMVLGFHEAGMSLLPNVGRYFKGNDFMLEHIAAHPLEQMLCTISFCSGGILERFPTLKVGFLEGNCSWLPFLLWRMDEHIEWLEPGYGAGLTMMPSEYFKRQCFVSVESDEDPVEYVIADGHGDCIIYSTDFPHGDSKYPGAVERFMKLSISDEAKRKILWDNCAGYYNVK